MSYSLQQINITYVPEEDRLLLKARAGEDKEYRVWLTRRYTALLLQVLGERMNTEGGLQELASRQATREHLRGGAMELTYDNTSIRQFPIGEAGVLGFRINTGKTSAGQLNLQLLPAQGQGLSLALDQPLLFLLYNLLEQALAHTDWQLSLPLERPTAVH